MRLFNVNANPLVPCASSYDYDPMPFEPGLFRDLHIAVADDLGFVTL